MHGTGQRARADLLLIGYSPKDTLSTQPDRLVEETKKLPKCMDQNALVDLHDVVTPQFTLCYVLLPNTFRAF